MYADPHACPDCRAPITLDDPVCPSCALPLTGPQAVELFRTLRRADVLLGELRSRRLAPVPAGGVPEPTSEPTPEPTPEPPAPLPESPLPAYPVDAATADETERARLLPKRWSVPTVLLTLGGLCLAVGAVVFLAVTWSLLGVGGRTAILVLATAAAAAGTWLTAGRNLRGAAETLAALGSVLLVLDVAGGVAAGWFGSPPFDAVLLGAGATVGAAAVGANALLRARGGALLTLQAVAGGSAYAAGSGLLSLADGSPYAWATVCAGGAAVSLLALRTRQVVLAWGLLALAGLAWAALTVVGVGAGFDHVRWGRPYDASGLLLAGVLAAAVVPTARFGLSLPRPLRVASGTVAIWWGVLAATFPLLTGATAVLTVACMVAVVAVVGALSARSRTPLGGDVLRLTSVTAAVGATALTALQALALLAATAGAVVAGGPLLGRFEVANLLVAPWAPLLGAVAAAAGWTAVIGRRPPVAGAAAVVLAGVALVVLAVLPYLVLPTAGALVGAAALARSALRLPEGPARARLWAPVVVLAVAALLLATYHRWTLLVVAGALALVALVVVLRGTERERRAASLVITPLVAFTAALLGAEAGLPGDWSAATCAVVALVTPVALIVGRTVSGTSRDLALLGAAGPWVVAAGLVASVAAEEPGPGLVTAGTAALLGLAGLRWARPVEAAVAAVLTPPLLAATAACAAALGSAPGPWVAAVALVVVVVVVLGAVPTGWARVVREERRWLAYAATGVSCAGAAVAGSAAAGAHGTHLSWLAAYLTLTAAGAAVVAILERSRRVAALASGLSLAALWTRLWDSDVDIPEAYTLPTALVVLAFGVWVFRRDPEARSLPTLGPGIALGLAPSLLLALGEPISVRALLVGFAALALVALGAVRRWQAPLLAGAGAGAVLVTVELFPYQSAIPRFVLFSAIGLVLLVAGIRWEALAVLGRRTWGRIVDLR